MFNQWFQRSWHRYPKRGLEWPAKIRRQLVQAHTLRKFLVNGLILHPPALGGSPAAHVLDAAPKRPRKATASPATWGPWRNLKCLNEVAGGKQAADYSLLKDTSRRSLGKKKSFTKNPFKNTVPVVQPIPLISIGNLRGMCEPSSFTRVFEVPNPHVRIQPILTLPKLPVGLAENSVYFWFHKNIPNLFQMKILIPFCGCKATPHWLQLLTKRTKKHTTDEAPRTQTNQKKAPTRKRANKPQRRGWCRDGLLMEGWYGCPRDLDYEAFLHDL